MRPFSLGFAVLFVLFATGCAQTEGQSQDLLQITESTVSHWILKSVRNDIDRTTTPAVPAQSILLEVKHLKFSAVDLGRNLTTQAGLVVTVPETGPHIHYAGNRDFTIEFVPDLIGIPTLMNRYAIVFSNDSVLELSPVGLPAGQSIGLMEKDLTKIFRFEAVTEATYQSIKDTYFDSTAPICGPDQFEFLREFEGC